MRVKAVLFNNYKFFISLILSLSIYLSYSYAYDLDEYFPLSQGNRWAYSHIVNNARKHDREDIRVEGDEAFGNINTVKMFYSKDQYECFAIDSEGIKIFKEFEGDVYRIFEPPKIAFPYLGIGEDRKYNIKSILHKNDGKEIEFEDVTYILLESTTADVEVPAGKFENCLRFSVINKSNRSNGGYNSNDCTVWLASRVGKVKHFCIHTKYKADGNEEDTKISIQELISAFIDGQKIGEQ